MSVLETTVNSGFCCGCGVCAGTCPSQNLAMEFNKYGEYNPVKIRECRIDCGICENVCPFFDGNPNEDELGQKLFASITNIRHRSETGYYLTAGVGAVSDMNHRMASASGGLATWFLEELLRQNIVDAVVSVQHADDEKLYGESKRLFCFSLAETPDEVQRGTGSAYYPVEISEMLQIMLAEEKRYAVIGLPCVLKGLRLAAEKMPKLKKRIVIMAGLACYHLTSTKFTEYALATSELQEEIASVSYRSKSLTVPPVFSKFTFVGKQGTVIERDFIGSMFGSRFCSLRSCECCDDMHAELADITFMDAWLPEYANEPRGTSLYIARHPLAKEIISAGMELESLAISPIAIDEVIKAQKALHWKREMLRYRLSLMKKRGWNPPAKRVLSGDGGELSFIERDECRKCLDMYEQSRERVLEGYDGVEKWFQMEMRKRPLHVFVCRVVLRIGGMAKGAPGFVWRKVRKCTISLSMSR